MSGANEQRQRRWLVRNTNAFAARIATPDPDDRRDGRTMHDWYFRGLWPTDLWRYQRVRRDSIFGTSVVFKVQDTNKPNDGHRLVYGGTLTQEIFDESVMGPPNTVKRRFELGASAGTPDLHLDVFDGAYAGLQILEWNDPPGDADERVRRMWPDADLLEVTDTLTSAHIANLPALDDPERNLAQVHQSVANDVRMIVMTGPPGAGKSAFLAECVADPRIHVVPEVASILISQLGVRPFGAAGLSERFQIRLRQIQVAFEALARSEAQRKGCKAVLLDRGTLDAAAYLPGKTAEFAKRFGIHPEREGQRYHGVIVLGLPPRDVYDRIRGNNPARTETYEQAEALAFGIRQAWCHHPLCTRADSLDWDIKREQVREALERMLG